MSLSQLFWVFWPAVVLFCSVLLPTIMRFILYNWVVLNGKSLYWSQIWKLFLQHKVSNQEFITYTWVVLKVWGVQSEKKQWGHSTLWCCCAAGRCLRHTTFQSHKLWSVCEVVNHPGGCAGIRFYFLELLTKWFWWIVLKTLEKPKNKILEILCSHIMINVHLMLHKKTVY